MMIAVGGAVLGGMFALLRWFGARMLTELEERLDAMERRNESVMAEIGRIDGDVKRLLAELPVHYQRREDAIREYTAINAKLDRLYEVIMESRRV